MRPRRDRAGVLATLCLSLGPACRAVGSPAVEAIASEDEATAAWAIHAARVEGRHAAERALFDACERFPELALDALIALDATPKGDEIRTAYAAAPWPALLLFARCIREERNAAAIRRFLVLEVVPEDFSKPTALQTAAAMILVEAREPALVRRLLTDCAPWHQVVLCDTGRRKYRTTCDTGARSSLSSSLSVRADFPTTAFYEPHFGTEEVGALVVARTGNDTCWLARHEVAPSSGSGYRSTSRGPTTTALLLALADAPLSDRAVVHASYDPVEFDGDEEALALDLESRRQVWLAREADLIERLRVRTGAPLESVTLASRFLVADGRSGEHGIVALPPGWSRARL